MGSISVTFTGSTMEEVASLIAAWTPPAAGGAGRTRAAATPALPADAAAAIGRVLAGVNGQKSRRLLRLLAEAGLKGDVVKLSETLVREFGVTGGTAFAGMIGPVNRRAMAIMGRSLIHYPEPKLSLWKIAPQDARAVLDALNTG